MFKVIIQLILNHYNPGLTYAEKHIAITVNSEIFMSILFSRILAMEKKIRD